MNAGVDKLGFNKLGGGLLLAGWIVILVVLLVLVRAPRTAVELACPASGCGKEAQPPWKCLVLQGCPLHRLKCGNPLRAVLVASAGRPD